MKQPIIVGHTSEASNTVQDAILFLRYMRISALAVKLHLEADHTKQKGESLADTVLEH